MSLHQDQVRSERDFSIASPAVLVDDQIDACSRSIIITDVRRRHGLRQSLRGTLRRSRRESLHYRRTLRILHHYGTRLNLDGNRRGPTPTHFPTNLRRSPALHKRRSRSMGNHHSRNTDTRSRPSTTLTTSSMPFSAPTSKAKQARYRSQSSTTTVRTRRVLLNLNCGVAKDELIRDRSYFR